MSQAFHINAPSFSTEEIVNKGLDYMKSEAKLTPSPICQTWPSLLRFDVFTGQGVDRWAISIDQNVNLTHWVTEIEYVCTGNKLG